MEKDIIDTRRLHCQAMGKVMDIQKSNNAIQFSGLQMSNNIIHPTRCREGRSGGRCLGQVMATVRMTAKPTLSAARDLSGP
jgi:hypothetical protein